MVVLELSVRCKACGKRQPVPKAASRQHTSIDTLQGPEQVLLRHETDTGWTDKFALGSTAASGNPAELHLHSCFFPSNLCVTVQDEYVVYKDSQARVRYMLTVKFT